MLTASLLPTKRIERSSVGPSDARNTHTHTHTNSIMAACLLILCKNDTQA